MRALLRSVDWSSALGLLFDSDARCALLCNFLFKAAILWSKLFVLRNFDKFLTILASIVCYDGDVPVGRARGSNARTVSASGAKRDNATDDIQVRLPS